MLISRMFLISFGVLCLKSNTPPLHEGDAYVHPYYVSVSQVEENAKEKNLEITCRIFTDDFEKKLREDFNTPVDLLNPAGKTAMGKLISKYIREHLRISVDGKLCVFQYLGFEQQEEAVNCYFQVNDVVVDKTVAVINTILFDYTPEQVNIVHVTVRGIRKSTKLVNPDSKVSLDFP